MADRLEKEVRFAVVMYGGVSLAIYINGVAQELMSLVRATARSQSNDSEYHLPGVDGVEKVYRELGNRLSARFVVDILSGTSAGGINAVYLAKALANDQRIDGLKELWIEEGDIEKLVNDKQSVSDLDGLKVPAEPASLLNSQRMFYKLLWALRGMEEGRASSDMDTSPYVDELDLFITATDLKGLPVPVRSRHGEIALERRFRNVFHFRYATPDAVGTAGTDQGAIPLNEFLEKYDPFLAFAARCTSSFPFAFEPMRLQDIKGILGRHPFNKYAYTTGDWSGFYRDYKSDRFPDLAFGDGGYLDNKPFSYATATLSRRRADLPVDRKLVYIDPAPEQIEETDPGEPEPPPDALANVLLAVSTLPRYETIREDLQAVNDRNEVIHAVNDVLRNIEHIYTLERKKLVYRKPSEAQKPAPPWRNRFLNDMLDIYGASYIPYHQLRVEEVMHNLAAMFVRGMGWEEGSPHAGDLLSLLHEWRKVYYKSSSRDRDLRSAIQRKSENDLLFRLDTGWYIRRLHYLRGLIDALLKDLNNEKFLQPDSRSKSILDHSGAGWKVSPANEEDYRSALLLVKRRLNNSYISLRGQGRAMRARNLVDVETTPDAGLEEYRARLNGLKDHLEARRPDPGKQEAAAKKDDPVLITRLDATIRYIARKDTDKNPSPQDAADYAESLGQLEGLTAILTEPAKDGMIYRSLYGTSNMIQLALGRKSRSPEVDSQAVETNPVLGQVQECLGFYDDRFEEFDMLTFPITYGTDVGESDEVETIRISPDDAVALKGPGNGNTKLRGTKLGNFGAFFSREWRENDMVWGRLDAAECLIKAVWPDDEDPAERDQYIRDAHKSIIEEFMLAPHRKMLMEKYLGITSDVKKKEVEEAISTVLGDKDKLVDKFLKEYKVNPNLPPESTLRVMARSTSVLGKLLGGLSPRYPVFSQPAGILTRFGRIFFGIVSVAISQSVAGMIFDNLIRWVYVLELLLLTVARIFIEIDIPGRGVDYTAWGTRISRLGVQAVLYTFLIHLAVLLFRTLTGRELFWTKVLRVLLIILVIVLAAAVLILSYSEYF